MGLIDAVARLAAAHAHVLVVEAPGSWRIRAAVERAAAARGWRLASSAADADILAVCGDVQGRLADTVALVWEQLPGPRVQEHIRGEDEVVGALDRAHEALLDTARHRQDARQRLTAAGLVAPADHGDADHGDADQGDADHGDADHGEMDHGEMAPGGIPLAEGGADRDGLELDVLTVRLGPVLPCWPAGVVLETRLQGDVVTGAGVRLLADHPHGVEPATLAQALDDVTALLALAGWPAATAESRRVRDALIAEAGRTDELIRRLTHRVRRSRLLRRSLRGVGAVDDDTVTRLGLSPDHRGDCYDRLLRTLARASVGSTMPTVPLDSLPALVGGLDLATARLMVASLGRHRLTSTAGEHAHA